MFDFYKNKRVFVTGHTGFKGAWLCEILLASGAEVYGYALKPPTNPSLFSQLGLAKRIKSHVVGDVRNLSALTAAVKNANPDVIFHLAAQPIVRESYREPMITFDTNVMGTVNLLEAVRVNRQLGHVAVVCITTDKVYENDESARAFKEGDPLGGRDPYSASKGACEIAVASYARSFFFSVDSNVTVASARAGNVIGGGDWASDRIVPDAMRAYSAGVPLVIRNRHSTRPWQHVLEPLSGYLALAASGKTGAFNFGPDSRQAKTVGALVKELTRNLPGLVSVDRTDPNAPVEAKFLRLDSHKAKRDLGWKPHWDFKTTIAKTAEWYASVLNGGDAASITRSQIKEYFG